MKAYTKKQILFACVANELVKVENLRKQTSSFERVEYLQAASKKELNEQIRSALFKVIKELVNIESDRLVKVCGKFSSQIELIQELNITRVERNESASVTASFIQFCLYLVFILLTISTARYLLLHQQPMLSQIHKDLLPPQA